MPNIQAMSQTDLHQFHVSRSTNKEQDFQHQLFGAMNRTDQAERLKKKKNYDTRDTGLRKETRDTSLGNPNRVVGTDNLRIMEGSS